MKITYIDKPTYLPMWTIEKINQIGEMTVYEDFPNETEAIKRLSNTDIAIVEWTPINKNMVEKIVGLKYLIAITTSFDYIDINALKARGIHVSNCPTYSKQAVAEHVFALMLSVNRNILLADQTCRAGKSHVYPPFLCTELRGKTLGIVGLGQIGRTVSNIANKSRTSGSTGVPLTLINDTNHHRHTFVQRLQMFENMMDAKLESEDWIYNIYYEPFLLTSLLGKFPTFTVGLGASLPDLVEHIREIRPAVITGVANRVREVAKLLPDAKDLGIKLFSTNSETSSSYIRKELSTRLGVPILDEYSSEELGTIAWEQQNGDYIVAEDNVYVELLKLNDDYMDTVIGTELWNFAMPRIRYVQNDFAEWKEENPEFGLKRIKRIIGRQDMKIISPQYGSIDPSIISETFDTTLVREDSGVKEFRLVQKSLHDIRLLIKKETEVTDVSEAVSEFKYRFQQYYGYDTELKIEYVDSIPSLGLKRRSIVREFNE